MTTEAIASPGARQGTATRQRGKVQVENILSEAQRLLVAEGYAGLTTRKVARNLGISIGNLTYYFPTKEKLLEALITDLLDQYGQAMDAARETFPDDPHGRFLAYLEYLIDDCLNADTRATFFQIWGLATHNEMVAMLRERVYTMAIDSAREVIAPLNPAMSEQEINELTISFIAMIEGLHVMLDLDQSTIGTSAAFPGVIRDRIYDMVLRHAGTDLRDSVESHLPTDIRRFQ